MSGNFAAALEATAARHPDRPAVIWDGGALTHRQLHRRAAAFARFLHVAGRGPGDRIALAIDNRWPFVAALLGALKLGATVAPLDPRLTREERAAVLQDLRPAAVAHEVVGDEADWPTHPAPPGPALVLYTSGSTGRPRGALLSHRALAFAIASWAGPVLALEPDDVVLAGLPLSHSLGLNGALLAPLLAGAAVVLLERFTAEAALGAIAAHGVTVFPGVATMFRRCLAAAGPDGGPLRGLRLAAAGAGPCPWDLVQEWRERTGSRLLRGYGMTELFRPVSHLAADPEDHPDAVGRAVPGVEVRVVDGAGRPRPPGAVGELWIRSPAALDGYLGPPEDTAAVPGDGWFRTGDLASVSAAGWVRIEGRLRERILRGGYSVFPAEVEAVLAAHPAVAEAAVVGVPDDELGEEVAAFVALREGATADAAGLLAWCRDRLAAFKYPRKVVILPGLPKGPTGKVQKSRLRA